VTTIMLNYVAQWLLRFLIIGGPLQLGPGTSKSLPIGDGARLATLLPADNSLIVFGLPSSVFRVHTGLLIALAAAALFAFVLWRTSFGYEIRAVGQSQKAARYAGVSVRRTIILTMLIAGAFSGLAGAIQIAGVDHNLTDKYFSDTTGFDAIAGALLGRGLDVGGGDRAPRDGMSGVEDIFRLLFTANLWQATLAAAVLLLLPALGGVISERSGVVNIAMEGMMLTGAFFAVVADLAWHNAWLATGVAVLAGALMATIHAVVSIQFRADQIVSGIAINIFAAGLTVFLVNRIYGIQDIGHVTPSESLPSINVGGLD